jgi:hypothetical protein
VVDGGMRAEGNRNSRLGMTGGGGEETHTIDYPHTQPHTHTPPQQSDDVYDREVLLLTSRTHLPNNQQPPPNPHPQPPPPPSRNRVTTHTLEECYYLPHAWHKQKLYEDMTTLHPLPARQSP